jgi:hypothetical protein
MWLNKVCDVATVLLVICVVVVGGRAVLKDIRKIIPLLLVAVLLTACSAPDSVYQVSNTTYSFNSADVSRIDVVSFDLDHRASVVSVNVADSKFFLCESAEPFTHWTCDLGGVLVSGNTSMRVVALP